MKLFFRKYGSGPVLIILHGLYGSSDNWVSVARKISHRFTVILPDLRNHGQSPHSNEHNYDTMADDLHELVSDQLTGRFLLAGHSMGGKVAMKYATKWPEKINSLIIFDISPFGTPDTSNPLYIQHKHILEAILSTDLKKLRTREEVENKLSRSIESVKIRGFLMKNLLRNEDGTFLWKLNAAVLLQNLPVIMDGIFLKGESTQAVTGFPVIFVRGAESDYLRAEEFSEIPHLFPAADFITVEKAGHWIHAERPGSVTEILLNLV